MKTLREWVARLHGVIRPTRDDADIEAELRAHLELAAEDARRRATSDDAVRAVRVRLGAVSRAMNALRDQRGLPWFEDLFQDVRYAGRALRRSPIFAAVVVLSLGLGIGANSALFSLIDATLRRELPVEAPQELVQFRWKARSDWLPDRARFAGSASYGARGRRSPTFSNAAFDALSAVRGSVSGIFAFSRIMPVNATIEHQTDRATFQLVSADYFTALTVTPALGRALTGEDSRAAAEPAAVISDSFWRRRFSGDPAAVGGTIALDGLALTIVGVAPEAFRGVAAAGAPGPDVWIPLAFGPQFGPRHADLDFWWLSIMGRMQPGATPEQVRGNYDGAFREAVRLTDNPGPDDHVEFDVWPARRGAREEGPEDELEHAIILGGIFGVLLLVVCLNVANLFLSRSAARRTEIGVRLALGASGGRLVRQLLAESVTLAVCGGAVGVVLAYWGRGLFSASGIVPPDMDLRIDGPVFGVTFMISLMTGVLFGLVPALRATRSAKSGGIERLEVRRDSTSLLNRSLLVTQVALSVVLLVGAGLFVRTLGKWGAVDTGFDAEDLLVFQVSPSSSGDDHTPAAILRDRLATRIRAVPGVTAVTTSGPFWQENWFPWFYIDGQRRRPMPHWLAVRQNFFETLALPVVAGRGFTDQENERTGPPEVAVVDETFARLFFGEVSPIGRRVAFARGSDGVQIVGVVKNMWLPASGSRPEEVTGRIYFPEQAHPSHFNPDWAQWRASYRLTYDTSFEVRTASDPLPVLPGIRAAVREVDPALAVLDPTTIAQRIKERLSPTRVASLIWTAFGAVTLVLTAVGLYGLLAYSVVQRTREIGIRTALGARRHDIIRLITGQTSSLVTLGIVAGIAMSLGINQLITSFIFGVAFYDPITFAGVVLIISTVTGLASFLPARKASRVDPTVALRYQ
jgi:predicted permease